MPPIAASPRTATTASPLPVRPWADRWMRRLLRVEGRGRPGDGVAARRALSRSLWLSAARCTLTYLVVPLAGSLGPLGVVHGPLAVLLGLAAAGCSVQSTRRFWIVEHRRRWQYTAFAAVVLTLLTVGLVVDLTQLVRS